MESVCWGNSTVGSNPTLSATQSAYFSLSIVFVEKPRFSRPKGSFSGCLEAVKFSGLPYGEVFGPFFSARFREVDIRGPVETRFSKSERCRDSVTVFGFTTTESNAGTAKVPLGPNLTPRRRTLLSRMKTIEIRPSGKILSSESDTCVQRTWSAPSARR